MFWILHQTLSIHIGVIKVNHSEIKKASSKELWDYLKQGFADIETEDMIYYELYEVRGE